MQKKIIALAVAGLMSGAAFAQSNVTVYGIMDVGYARYSGTDQNAGVYTVGSATAATLNKIDSGLASSSRLGFKGSEDLGNGLKANFVAEFGLNADGGANAQGAGTTGLEGASRVMTLGLSSNWGSVNLGRQYTPFHDTLAAVDPFGTTGVASATVIHPDVANVARASSSIKYNGAFGPLSVGFLYGLGERSSDANIANGVAGNVASPNYMWSFNALYGFGAGAVGLAHIRLNDVGTGTAAQNSTEGLDVKSTLIGGLYDLGMVKLSAGVNLLTGNLAGTGKNLSHRDWHFGAVIPMGVHSFRIAYNIADDRLSASNGGTNDDAKHWGLGYQYDFSKRTNFYAMYGTVNNKNNASYSVTGQTSLVTHGVLGAGNAAGRTNGLALGLRHNF